MEKRSITKEKRAILLVAFGTSVPKAHTAYDAIQQRVEKAFPGIEVRRAYTSTIVRKKLLERGEEILSPAAALTRMADDGFTHVTIQSLHVIPGLEFHDLLKIAKAVHGLPKGLVEVKVGDPLLSLHKDYVRVANILYNHSKTFRNESDALILMGHGTPHASNICYAGLQQYFVQLDKNTHVATIEAFPSVEDVIPRLKENKTNRVWLMPLLTIAGDHVLNDMAGEKDESWKNILLKEGFEVLIHKTALGEINEVVDVWIDKIKQTIDR